MPQTPSARLGANIKAEMVRRGVRQATIADLLGITQSTFSKRLRGAIPIDINEVSAIAEHLDVPLATLLDGVPGATTPTQPAPAADVASAAS